MLKKLIILLLLCVPISATAAEFEFSVGAGHQYGGVIGTQFAAKTKDSKYYVAVGLPGYSLGMQKVLSENQYHTGGILLGELKGIFADDSRYGFLTYNYHLNGFKSSGWVFGAGIGMLKKGSYNTWGGGERVNPSKKAMYTLDVGYKF